MKVETGGEKLITLFDLQGKPIHLRENVPVHYVSNDYAHIHFTDDEEVCCVYVGIGIIASEIVRDENLLIPLVKFLNNQLTLIRKGEETGNWDDLDVYQTTLGEYWDIPSYRLPYKEVCLLKSKHGITINGRVFREVPYSSNYRIFTPTAKDFTHHYKDIFNKITPWKG